MTVYKGYRYFTRVVWQLKYTIQGYPTYDSPQFNPHTTFTPRPSEHAFSSRRRPHIIPV